ncbi:NAD-dependent aldehyde dehydrogenase [Trametes meyenii]|nr:NAD-dependent aldehyde dehydrogenase [Trametes meyenii]
MSTLTHTPIDDIPKIRERTRQAFLSGKTKSISFRKEQIAQIGYLLKDNEEAIKNSLKLDLGRPAFETASSDLGGVYTDVCEAYYNVENWAQSYNAEFRMPFAAVRPRLKAEPKGTALIISPFNYPVFLSVSPLVSAIAAGNAAVIKPSEKTPTFSALLSDLVYKYLDNDLYHVVNGGVPETAKALELQWDHIFYVGHGRVGRVIAAAAAKHLTPCTLELGGKSPVVVDSQADLKLVAKRVLWGKFANAGQICLAPDYLIIERGLQDALIAEMEEVYHAFYPEGPAVSDSFGRIVSEAHTARIKRLLDATEGTVVLGGDVDVQRKYVAPTILRDVREDDALLEDGAEIFGPVLPIVPVDDISESIRIINARKESSVGGLRVFNRPSVPEPSGAAVANDTVITASIPGLPIGGVGASGYGYYTGKHGFDEFTHLRVFSDNPAWGLGSGRTDGAGFGTRYPPYKMMIPPPTLPPRPAAGNVLSKSTVSETA